MPSHVHMRSMFLRSCVAMSDDLVSARRVTHARLAKWSRALSHTALFTQLLGQHSSTRNAA
eukprot:3204441-Pleurochrysis_carterae.AAC.1